MYFQKLLSGLAILALCGCANVRPLDNNGSRDELAGMFGLLDKSPAGYIFREFSDQTKNGETWVDLASLEPTWPMIKRTCAGYGLVALQDRNNTSPDSFTCMEKDTLEKLFYTRQHIDYTTPTGALIGGATIATGGLMAVLWVPSTEYFDTERYERAVQQAWSNSVENKGGIPFVLAEKARIQQADEARKQAEEEQAKVNTERRRERILQERRQKRMQREAMAQQIISKGVGAQVCNKQGDRLIRIGYVERIENNMIKITVADVRYGNSNIRPGGFQPGIVWDSPENWYLCHYR